MVYNTEERAKTTLAKYKHNLFDIFLLDESLIKSIGVIRLKNSYAIELTYLREAEKLPFFRKKPTLDGIPIIYTVADEHEELASVSNTSSSSSSSSSSFYPSLKGPHEYAIPGVSFYRGSLGFLVLHQDSIFGITCSHLWGPSRWQTNTDISQFNKPFGTLTRYIPYTTYAETNKRTRIPSDIAAVLKLPEAKAHNRPLYFPAHLDNSQHFDTLSDFTYPLLDQQVLVIGRETGADVRTVTETNMTATFSDFILENAFKVSGNFIPGDSGGLVCSLDGKVIGLMTGASGICSDAYLGLKALGMSSARPLAALIEFTLPSATSPSPSPSPSPSFYHYNGQQKPLDVPAQIINGRTMIPLRAAAEVFHSRVDWFPKDSTTKRVTLER